MTPFYSPNRPKLANGRPCWMDSLVALPSIDVLPNPDGSVTFSIMDGQGGWARFEGKQESLPWVLHQWLADPERACLELFKGRLPKGKAWSAERQHDLSADELGL